MTIAVAILAMVLIFSGLAWTLVVDMPAAGRQLAAARQSRKDPSA